ncbi:MAG TPA: hypothetical protein VGN42_12580 [Pirellulales bacterium]|nr:hypothetical protein [Pirellulales bacterium]
MYFVIGLAAAIAVVILIVAGASISNFRAAVNEPDEFKRKIRTEGAVRIAWQGAAIAIVLIVAMLLFGFF